MVRVVVQRVMTRMVRIRIKMAVWRGYVVMKSNIVVLCG